MSSRSVRPRAGSVSRLSSSWIARRRRSGYRHAAAVDMTPPAAQRPLRSVARAQTETASSTSDGPTPSDDSAADVRRIRPGTETILILLRAIEVTRLHEALERAQSLASSGSNRAIRRHRRSGAIVDRSGRTPMAIRCRGARITPLAVQRLVRVADRRLMSMRARPGKERRRRGALPFCERHLREARRRRERRDAISSSSSAGWPRRSHHAQLQSGDRTVMIASAVEAEGKTLTAANLALTLSHSYKRRVLLIDADLRRPAVHDLFQLDNRIGLGDVPERPASVKLPVQNVSPTLWVMTGGRPVRDPMSGLVSDTMRQILTDAAEQFDWVVVDTPPVALLPDANLLAAMIDVALLVVRANSTPYPLVTRAVEAIGTSRLLGIVLNRIERSQIAGGYGYYNYGYSYHTSPKVDARRWFRFPFSSEGVKLPMFPKTWRSIVLIVGETCCSSRRWQRPRTSALVSWPGHCSRTATGP